MKYKFRKLDFDDYALKLKVKKKQNLGKYGNIPEQSHSHYYYSLGPFDANEKAEGKKKVF